MQVQIRGTGLVKQQMETIYYLLHTIFILHLLFTAHYLHSACKAAQTIAGSLFKETE